MSVEEMVERALADHARDVSVVPDVEAMLARGIRARRRRHAGVLASVVAAAVVIGAVLFGGPVLWLDADRGLVAPPEVTPGVVPPKNVGIPWGPDVPFYLIGDHVTAWPNPSGRPFAGTQPWPAVDRVRTFTTTSTGVVYVTPGESPATGEIVFEGWDHHVVVLSRNPRSLSHEFGFASRQLWASPLHDLVAWTELDGEGAGEHVAVVVARASTGQQLGRTVLPGEKPETVWLRSLDAERLHVQTGLDDETWIWTWNWGVNATPMAPRDGTGFRDVAGLTWAGYQETDPEDWLRFETDTGRLLSRVDGKLFDGRSSLSPDGKYWFNGTYLRVADTLTGRTWALKPDDPNWDGVARDGTNQRWEWTGSTEITFVVDMPKAQAAIGLTTCDVVTLKCTDPIIPDSAAETFEGSDVSLPAR